MSDAQGKWIATLSDGTTAVENHGEWVVRPGERKPWVRLTQFAADTGLHLTSLRLQFRGRTIHMPRPKFDRFSMDQTSLEPDFYSLQYHVEVDNVLGSSEQNLFVDLAAHFGDITVHHIQDVTEGNNSWVVVTRGHKVLAPSPNRLGNTDNLATADDG